MTSSRVLRSLAETIQGDCILNRNRIIMIILMTLLMTSAAGAAAAAKSSQVKTVKGCQEPSMPRGGTFRLSVDEMSVEYLCQPGLSLVGSSDAKCSNGRWSNPEPVCVGGNCELPTVRHSVITSMHGGGLIRIECVKRFRRSGPEYMACVDRRWNATKPECTDEKDNDGGKADRKSKSVRVGKHQKPADQVDSADKSAKKASKEWLDEADYSCVRDGFTVYPPAVPNARAFTKWTMHDGKPRLYTTYQCKWGFKPTAGGVRTMYCHQGGWVGSPPKCQTVVHEEAVQGDSLGRAPFRSHEQLLQYADYSCIGATPEKNVEPPEVEQSSADLKFVILDGRPHLYVRYECGEGHRLVDDKHAHLYCKGRTWIGVRPKCIRAESTRSCATRNGECDQLCSQKTGGVVCACRSGYALQPDDRTCADVNECDVNGGNCEQVCDNTEGAYECSCVRGYSLDPVDGRSCHKVKQLDDDELLTA